jgi:hypothetical protein
MISKDPESLRQSCGSGSGPAFQVNPEPDPIRIQGFDDQKLREKNTNENFFLIKN